MQKYLDLLSNYCYNCKNFLRSKNNNKNWIKIYTKKGEWNTNESSNRKRKNKNRKFNIWNKRLTSNARFGFSKTLWM